MRRMDASKAAELVSRLRTKHGLGEKSTVGVWSAWDTKAETLTDDSNNDITAVVTTDDVDLEEEVLIPSGGDMTSYLGLNKSVFVDHYYALDSCVGKIRRLTPFPDVANPKGWKMQVSILRTSNSPMPGLVMDIAKQMGIGVSIGFEAQDWGKPTADEAKRYPAAKSVVRKWKAIEVSFTCLPCNVMCRGEAMYDDSKSVKLLRVMPEAAKRLRIEEPRKMLVVA